MGLAEFLSGAEGASADALTKPLADNECPHGHLPSDPAECGCWEPAEWGYEG